MVLSALHLKLLLRSGPICADGVHLGTASWPHLEELHRLQLRRHVILQLRRHVSRQPRSRQQGNGLGSPSDPSQLVL